LVFEKHFKKGEKTQITKGIVGRLYTELSKINNKNTNNPTQNALNIHTETSPKKTHKWKINT
jgi:hypothetical protein